jgi:hypothetical protein
MAILKERISSFQRDDYLEILSQSEQGGWELRLPPTLQQHQSELEQLLGKVFSSRQGSLENLALAQQMSLNWCMSKCRAQGVRLEDCWAEAS